MGNLSNGMQYCALLPWPAISAAQRRLIGPAAAPALLRQINDSTELPAWNDINATATRPNQLPWHYNNPSRYC